MICCYFSQSKDLGSIHFVIFSPQRYYFFFVYTNFEPNLCALSFFLPLKPLKYIFPWLFLTTEHHGTTQNRGYMFRVSVSIREIRGRLYISLPCRAEKIVRALRRDKKSYQSYFSSFHSLCVLRNQLRPLTFASLNR